MIGKPYRSYVALGDSLAEGLGDFTFGHQRRDNGWSDRLAGLISQEAADFGYDFHYANLSIRGSNLPKVMSNQVPAALRLQPDLVTVMAGSNDLLTPADDLPNLKRLFREGVQQLLAAGCDVMVANTINPIHLRVFRPLLPKAERVTGLIEEVAAEFDVPVIDVYRIDSFKDLCFWAEDMVHFSGHGHTRVANQAAELIGLNYRFAEVPQQELGAPARGLLATAAWVRRDVLPFIDRRLKGRTSGDGLEPKISSLEPYAPAVDHWTIVPKLSLSTL